jgi:hypothetical protein
MKNLYEYILRVRLHFSNIKFLIHRLGKLLDDLNRCYFYDTNTTIVKEGFKEFRGLYFDKIQKELFDYLVIYLN